MKKIIFENHKTNPSLELGEHWSFNIHNDPKRLGFVLSRYKFAAKMGGKEQRILELGCSEGIGAPILAEKALSYTGVDIDPCAIETAKKNLKNEKFSFLVDDFMDKNYGTFDCVVSLDVVEHILPEYEDLYFDTLFRQLSKDGVVIVGTPNITSSAYASIPSQLGHVNLYSQERPHQKTTRLFSSSSSLWNER